MDATGRDRLKKPAVEGVTRLRAAKPAEVERAPLPRSARPVTPKRTISDETDGQERSPMLAVGLPKRAAERPRCNGESAGQRREGF